MAYFPNGSAGEVLDRQCSECPVGRNPDAPCPILWAQLEWNYSQFDKDGKQTPASEVLNLLINEEGICQMKPVLEKYLGEDPAEKPIRVADVMPAMREWAMAYGALP